MKLSKVKAILNGTLQGRDVEFQSVSIDTRTLSPGDLFIAIRGPNFDGHDFIEQAIAKSASAVLVSEPTSASIPSLLVDDTRKALADLAAFHRMQWSGAMISVTGSCGKTTTKMLMTEIFSQAASTLSNAASFNNDIGVPLTLLQLKPEHQYAVCEVGANHPGEIAALTHIVKPDVAMITNAGAAHLAGFGDVKGVACAKGEIFQGLGVGGVAVVNADDQYADFWKKQIGDHRIITFGIKKTADVMAMNIQLNAQVQPHFRLILPNGEADIQLSLIGEHNIMNALAAAAAAYAKDVSIVHIKAGLEAASAVNRRLVEKLGVGGAVIIDDTYNANPLSTSAAISLLSKRPGESVFVLGDLVELGEQADQFHKELGLQAEQDGIQRLYCFGEHSRLAAEAFGKNAYHFENRDALIASLRDTLNETMTVLIKGSNAMGMDKIAKALMEK